MVTNKTLFLTTIVFWACRLGAQEVRLFTVEDFDLQGNVKTCEVITDYGREIFNFDETGRLQQLTTKYNAQDQDVTHYDYIGPYLKEKRLESYKNGVIDPTTSMANMYTLDTVGNMKINEKIISYDKAFFETLEYRYDDEGRLVKIITSHENAVDETVVTYEEVSGETTITHFLNGIIQKSTRSSKKAHAEGDQTVVLTKDYIDGEPSKAVETISDQGGKLLSKEVFYYDISEDGFASQEKEQYHYDEDGVLDKTTLYRGNSSSVQNYIFQFDSSPFKNWVKKIVTPDNTYVSRKIMYYAVAEEEGTEE